MHAAALALVVACGRDSRPSSAKALGEAPVRVGVILPLTGTLAEMGFYERHAMELALSRFGVRDVRLLYEDSRSTPAAAAAAANKLISVDGVRLLVVSTTGAALAVQPVANAASVPLIAFCMDPTITANDSSTVRFYIGVEEEADELLRYLETLQRTERVAVLHAAVPVWRKIMESTYLPRLRQHFERPTLVEEYELQEKDFRAALGRIAKSGATTLVVLGYGFEYPGMFKQMEELGLRRSLTRIVGGWGFLYAPLSAAQLEGVIVAGPQYVFSRSAAADSFANAFETAVKRPANFDAAFAYELVRTLPDLRASGALTDSTIKRGVQALGTHKGVVGEYHFTARGDMIVQTGLGAYRAGRLEPFGGR
ncbi:MAG: ABC transporter substrate-binding protein [Gemmatimonadetes bacterium]|nr:ABC transporter substrate-binding protein [Gemmatimonadota bacterium]